MERVKPATVADAREFFASELKKVMEKHRVSAEPDAFEYLVGLLVKSIHSDTLFTAKGDGQYEDTVLFNLYIEYMQAAPEMRRTILQRMGDICMLISGYFSESVIHKVVDLEYYFGMGGTAYRTLAELQSQKAYKAVYWELSEKFQPYSDVLGEMSERNGLQSNKDLLRVYERWLLTGSDRLKSILTDNGIQPAPGQKGVKH